MAELKIDLDKGQHAISAQVSATQAQLQKNAYQQAVDSNNYTQWKLLNQTYNQMAKRLIPQYVNPKAIMAQEYPGFSVELDKRQETNKKLKEELEKTKRKENANILSRVLRNELQTGKA